LIALSWHENIEVVDGVDFNSLLRDKSPSKSELKVSKSYGANDRKYAKGEGKNDQTVNIEVDRIFKKYLIFLSTNFYVVFQRGIRVCFFFDSKDKSWNRFIIFNWKSLKHK
jgi:hypothetical protein